MAIAEIATRKITIGKQSGLGSLASTSGGLAVNFRPSTTMGLSKESFTSDSIRTDQQRSTPLSVFRDAARFPVEVLHQLGAHEVQRVDVERWASPNDPFAVTPASLIDVGEAVHEAGIMWGAAKAAVHLARRREEGQR